MSKRFDEVSKIYDHKIKLLRNPQFWEQTLRQTASFWRLNFCAAMLLTAQNSKAEMCGTLAQWNNVGRYIRRGEHSTAVFTSRDDTQLLFLFDVSQTYGRAYNSKWKLSEDIADGIVGKFNAENSEKVTSFEEFLEKSLDKRISFVYNFSKELSCAIAKDERVAYFIRQSAECICAARCGLNGSYNFSDAAKFDSDLSIVEVGNAANALAQEVLREIDRTIRRNEYGNYRAGVCGRHLRYPLYAGRERNVQPVMGELRTRADDPNGTCGSRLDERTGPDSTGYDKYERAVPNHLEGSREPRGQGAGGRNSAADEIREPQSRVRDEREDTLRNRHSGAERNVGKLEDERIVAVGESERAERTSEDWQNPLGYDVIQQTVEKPLTGFSAETSALPALTDGKAVSSHSCADRSVFYLGEPEVKNRFQLPTTQTSAFSTDWAASAAGAVSVFSDEPIKLDADSKFARSLLDREILHGSGFAEGKKRIREYVLENFPETVQLADFLKKEYGIGGATRRDYPVAWSAHDNKGLTLTLKDNGETKAVLFSWQKVAKAVERAIANGSYLDEPTSVKVEKESEQLLLFDEKIQPTAEDTQIVSQLSNAVSENENQQNTTKTAEVENTPAVDVSEKSFAEQVDEVLNGTASRYNDLKVCDTPQILLDVGCEQLPMLYTQQHLRKAIQPKKLNEHTHGLDVEQMKKLPSDIASPVMILDSTSRSDSIIMILQQVDKENCPIVVSVKPNGNGKYNLDVVDSNFITSVYGRENFASFVERNIELDNILYCNKEKSQELFRVLRLQFPQGVNNLDSDIIIHQSRNIVKGSDEKISEEMTAEADITEESPFIVTPEVEVELQARQMGQLGKREEKIDVPAESKNYHFSDDFTYPVGAKGKYQANVNAIKTLKLIETQHRRAAPDEQEILAHYSGWGGIADAFDSSKESWSKEYAELKALLTEKEYTAARESTLTAFYTEPYLIKGIYGALADMGFEGGCVLDPAAGTGNFWGCMPQEMAQNSRLYGVELDSISARITKLLYPDAEIQNKGFEHSRFDNDTFDIVVGNVPFGNFSPYDTQYEDYVLHDYFFVKSIDKLKAGGIMALITSAGTMDKFNDAARVKLAQKADLLDGIRLPEDAFKTAGTQTVTDVLFFQKLDSERSIQEAANIEWVKTSRFFGKHSLHAQNNYFVAHPQMTLGRTEEVSSAYGYTLTVKSDGDTQQRFSEALHSIKGTFSAAPTIDAELAETDYGDIPIEVQPYTFYIRDDALFYAENRKAVPYNEKNAKRVKAMCEVMKCLDDVVFAQTENYEDDVLVARQQKLNEVYDAFVEKYGALNSRTNKSAFGDDVRAPRLSALENVEELPDGTQRISKADIFTQRTIYLQTLPTHAESALDALHISLNIKQMADIEYMAELCGKEMDDVISELGDRIYCNPAKNNGDKYSGWETAEEYLSGKVVAKLDLAVQAAKDNPMFERNVAALSEHQPPRLGIEDIGFRLGSIYIPKEMFQKFIYETFDTPVWQRENSSYNSRQITVQYIAALNEWKISNCGNVSGVLSEETYGTKRLNAYELTQMLLNQKRAVVYDYEIDADGNKQRIFNRKETILARECQDKIEQAFSSWVLADMERVRTIEDIFNTRYNSTLPRKYNGEYIKVRGMNPALSLRPHQKDVIARIAANGTCMMAHEVGAGKTAAMAAAGMYLKSIGLCKKPLYVVPKPVIGQFSAEFQRFFPSAKLLTATANDMAGNNRRRFLSKISAGNYDAIIITQPQFEKMPLSPERQEEMFAEKIDEITAEINAARAANGERFTVKALERERKSIEKKIAKMRADFKKDDFITFEELGCDFLFVDEAHNYKNLAVFSKMSNVAGVNANQNSQKAFDMEMKCRYLQELNDGGGVVLATGTPISNSITELFVWQYLLQRQTLADMNIDYFDNWASVYGKITQDIEAKPSGDGFRPRTRFSSFENLNELCNVFCEVFDIAKTADMDLMLPAVAGGKPEMIICNQSPEQEEQTNVGMERARLIEEKKVRSNEDNMLAICTYMTKVALDARIIDPDAQEFDGGKVARCAEKILEIKREKPNSAQAVFCDTNTPKGDSSFSVYHALKSALLETGEFTEDEIAFVHDADTDSKRLALFDKVNNAEVKVIIGSTSKLGTGVNIQRNLSALHHLDAPYRPSDIEQRNGRAIRQGNTNSEVFIGYYATKGTFDNYRWQILEKKQQLIAQIMSGKPAARTCEDIDETALTYAEMKAATTGNPLVAEKMRLDNEVDRLKLLQANHIQQMRTYEHDITVRYPELITRKEKTIAQVKRDIDVIGDNPHISDEEFEITLGGEVFTERVQAGKALEKMVLQYMNTQEYSEYKPHEIGRFNSFTVSVCRQALALQLYLNGNAKYSCDYLMSGSGGITRLCNLYERIPNQLNGLQQSLEEVQKQLATAKEQYGKPFEYADQLQGLLERLSKINSELEFGLKAEEIMDDDENEEMEL